MSGILLAILILCALTGGLAVLLLVAEYFFASYGPCTIGINAGEKTLTLQGGQSLLRSLTEQKVFIPSACGGRGSCGFCKCRVLSGAGPVLPTELPYLTEEDLAGDVRLSCQIKVKSDLEIEIPSELLSVRDFAATVERVVDLTHDIKGVRLALGPGDSISFRAGQYVQLVAPPYGEVRTETSRAYSVASAPSGTSAIDLIIRLVPNGIVTTYVFEHLREGMAMRFVGPFGDFFLRDSDRECVFIAGGSGLAPFRSMLYDMIERGFRRRTRFFFGAVNPRDLYYVDEFMALGRAHDWFEFVPALSGDAKEGDAAYERGLITEVVDRSYESLAGHEGYLCGSPGMIDACIRVLSGKGMPEGQIFYDKFS